MGENCKLPHTYSANTDVDAYCRYHFLGRPAAELEYQSIKSRIRFVVLMPENDVGGIALHSKDLLNLTRLNVGSRNTQ